MCMCRTACVCHCRVVASFLAAGLPCVSPAFLVEWLADPWQDLSTHFLFGSKPTGSSELAALEAARGEGRGAQEPQRSESF